jgi:hypothetical protein
MAEDLRITDHARERMLERGCSVDEVEETIRTGAASRGRTVYQSKEKTFPVQVMRLEERYREKRVEVVFIRDADTAHVVTVIARYVA